MRDTRARNIVVWFHDLKKGLKCSLCPETFWASLDFHHRDPKTKTQNVSRMVRDGWSKARILIEIAKCDVLCKNCHAKEEWRHIP